jgi:hypothetical protein
MIPDARTRHEELVLRLAGQDQRLLDAISQRPHLLNPYPKITTRLARRSRKFRRTIEKNGESKPSETVARLHIVDSPPAA